MSKRNIAVILLWIILISGAVYVAIRLNDSICDEGVPACDDDRNCYCMYEIPEEQCNICADFCRERGREHLDQNVRNSTCICRCLQ